jgi:hypothetical protein
MDVLMKSLQFDLWAAGRGTDYKRTGERCHPILVGHCPILQSLRRNAQASMAGVHNPSV